MLASLMHNSILRFADVSLAHCVWILALWLATQMFVHQLDVGKRSTSQHKVSGFSLMMWPEIVLLEHGRLGHPILQSQEVCQSRVGNQAKAVQPAHSELQGLSLEVDTCSDFPMKAFGDSTACMRACCRQSHLVAARIRSHWKQVHQDSRSLGRVSFSIACLHIPQASSCCVFKAQGSSPRGWSSRVSRQC